MKRVFLLWFAVLLLLVSQTGSTRLLPASVEAAPDTKLEQLYAHVSKRGYKLYKLGSGLPPGLSDGPWKIEGAVCLVYRNAAPGTRPVYQLFKGDEAGVRFDYTANAGYVKKATSGAMQSDTWTDGGIAFHVATTQSAGTIPLFRIHKPGGILATGPNAGELDPGSDATLLTTDAAEKDKLINAGWKGSTTLGYVWPKSQPTSALPDLSVRDITASDFAVKALIVNQGKANTGGASVYAHLFLQDANGTEIFSDGKFVGGLSSGQAQPIAFETGGRNLSGVRYQIKLDISNLVKESDETNNVTPLAEFRRKIKITPDPNAANRIPAPSINLNAVQPSATQNSPKRTIYRVAVTNSSAYPPELFQPTQKLPPRPCGSGQTDARLVAHLFLVRSLGTLKVGCKPIETAVDLKSIDIESSVVLSPTDQVRITLEDRETRQEYKSEPYSAGWFGVGKTLVSAGCKSFLGRAGSYLCTSDSGMATCESLRQQGKPIQCTRAGNTE